MYRGAGGNAPRWVYERYIKPRIIAKETVYAAYDRNGIGRYPQPNYQKHLKSKRCFTNCGACYERAKGRNYR